MSQTVAITLSGLIAIVHLQNGGLGLVIPQAGNHSHLARFEWTDVATGKRMEAPLKGISVVIEGLPTGQSKVVAQRKWGSDKCPVTEKEGTPGKGEKSLDWSVEMRCLGEAKVFGEIPRDRLSDPAYVKARMDLGGTVITLQSKELAKLDSGTVISRFHEKGNPQGADPIHLYQATADEMLVSLEVGARDYLLVRGMQGRREAWVAKAGLDPESGRYTLAFRNDTPANHPDCTKSLASNICVAFSQEHFLHYYAFFPDYPDHRDRPWPGDYAEISAFLEGADLWNDAAKARPFRAQFEAAFGIKPMQAGSGGRPICMLASFREGN